MMMSCPSDIYFSARTWQRMKVIEEQLLYYQDSINLLQAFNDGRETLKDKGYTWKVACSRRTPDDKLRYRYTLQNLKLQVALLKHELAVLQEYGV